jgi:hypothetical protein
MRPFHTYADFDTKDKRDTHEAPIKGFQACGSRGCGVCGGFKASRGSEPRLFERSHSLKRGFEYNFVQVLKLLSNT